MNTYTEPRKTSKIGWSSFPYEPNACFCVKYIRKEQPRGLQAKKDCPNCLGYGIMPIPWSELNK